MPCHPARRCQRTVRSYSSTATTIRCRSIRSSPRFYNEAESVPAADRALRSRSIIREERLDIKIVVERDDTLTRVTRSIGFISPRLRDHRRAVRSPAHQTESAQCRPALRARTICRGLRCRRPAGACCNCVHRAAPSLRSPAGGDRLACVQARLTIDNTKDSWLTRLFTAEYAGLFDVFLPGLAAFSHAAAARRHVEPFPHRDVARDRRLGSLQRHRRRRSRHSASRAWGCAPAIIPSSTV